MITSESKAAVKLFTLPTATSIAVSSAICCCAVFIAKLSGIQGGTIPVATALVVVLASVFPSVFNHLAPSAEALSLVLMQVKMIFFSLLMSMYNIITCYFHF